VLSISIASGWKLPPADLEPLHDAEQPGRVLVILARLYPEARCALHFSSPFQLLVATILSAQCTDQQVNRVTPELFRRYPDAAALAQAPLAELEQAVHATGFYRSKARHLLGMAEALMMHHAGEVPQSLQELVALPGVGRKTANVVLGTAFGIPGMVVDTHVKRVSFRLGWTRHHDPIKIESDLGALLPRTVWTDAGHLLIEHGRALCKAPAPLCTACPLFAECPRQGVRRSR
jgi:endonuclease III